MIQLLLFLYYRLSAKVLAEDGPIPPFNERPATAPVAPPSTDPADAGKVDLNGSLDSYVSHTLAVVSLVLTGLAILYLINAGIQYTSSGGSPEKVKKARTAIIHGIIGLFFFLSSYAILNLIIRIAENSANQVG